MTIASRLGLPTGGAVIAAWVNPCAWWWSRLAAAIGAARPENQLERGRARRSRC